MSAWALFGPSGNVRFLVAIGRQADITTRQAPTTRPISETSPNAAPLSAGFFLLTRKLQSSAPLTDSPTATRPIECLFIGTGSL